MKHKINEDVLKELLSKQIKNIDITKKFDYSDIKRISKYLNKSIFNTNECVIWSGYITNINNISKGVYINFYFRKKKYALHRLLYSNYIGNLYSDEYLKFMCPNKGTCCNINHFNKFKYNPETDKIENNNKIIIKSPSISNMDEFIIDFE